MTVLRRSQLFLYCALKVGNDVQERGWGTVGNSVVVPFESSRSRTAFWCLIHDEVMSRIVSPRRDLKNPDPRSQPRNREESERQDQARDRQDWESARLVLFVTLEERRGSEHEAPAVDWLAICPVQHQYSLRQSTYREIDSPGRTLESRLGTILECICTSRKRCANKSGEVQ